MNGSDDTPRRASDGDHDDPGRLRAIHQSRDGALSERLATDLIHLERNVSGIELSLTAITAAVVVLQLSFGELSKQIASFASGGQARQIFDVSIAVAFLAIAVATLQIPRHFTDSLVYSNQDAIRLLALHGATPLFTARCFQRVVWRAMRKAVLQGLLLAGSLYLVISEIMQLWVPVTRTYFLIEFATTALIVLTFVVLVMTMVRVKVQRLYEKYYF